MKNISLKLQEKILEDTEGLLEQLHMSRNKYINEAIEYYNEYQRRKLIEKQLIRESMIVSKDSLKVLEEFEVLEDEI
jgi:metal-responsive CopG/Arc/MetJ family transcriptional regulator